MTQNTPLTETITYSGRSYPLSFRAQELKVMARWIDGRESGCVIGLAGAGKSNLLGLITHHPNVIQRHCSPPTSKLVLIPVDLNNLAQIDLVTFYRTLLRALYEAHAQWAKIDSTMVHYTSRFYQEVYHETDPFVCQSVLREFLFLCQDKGLRLVLVLDPFDQFCKTATTPMLDTLRGIRDSFKATLSYIVGMRQLLTYLRDPVELGELHEILDLHRCWLGALKEPDARVVLAQIEANLGQRYFTETERQQILHVTGGYPALLKAVAWWLAQQQNPPSFPDWVSQLMQQPSINNRLQELWGGLTGEEQMILKQLEPLPEKRKNPPKKNAPKAANFNQQHLYVLNELAQKQLCVERNGQWSVFSPLFAQFLQQAPNRSLGKITYHEAQNTFFQGETELQNLAPKEHALLKYFIDHPYRQCSLDDLANAVWPDDNREGVLNTTIQHTIYELRQKIEPFPLAPCYLVIQYKQGYRFFPEGAPQS